MPGHIAASPLPATIVAPGAHSTGGTLATPTGPARTPGPRPTPSAGPLKVLGAPPVAPTAAASPGALPDVLRAPAPRLRTPESLATADFTLATFNVLGASHTADGGTHPRFDSGAVRARRAARLLMGADVIGFQELQTPQLRVLRNSTDLDFYPGLSQGPFGAENSIGWRRGTWVPVERHVVQIPYFDGGLRAMPYVRLRHRATGLEAWFLNVHNPADTRRFPRQQRFRVRATTIEATLVNRLVTRSGLPVLLTGDMNERGPYFCRLTDRAPLVAARGGTNIGGTCEPGDPRQIDWIFGSQGVVFSGYAEYDGRVVARTSDHPLVTARVRLQAAPSSSTRGG